MELKKKTGYQLSNSAYPDLKSLQMTHVDTLTPPDLPETMSEGSQSRLPRGFTRQCEKTLFRLLWVKEGALCRPDNLAFPHTLQENIRLENPPKRYGEMDRDEIVRMK